MPTTHPKLIEILVDQTPRAMIAMLIVSSAYFFIYIKFIPFYILAIWFLFQILLAILRLHNTKNFKNNLKNTDSKELKKNEIYFIILNIFQALMWTISSVLSIIYAPQPFELVTFIMVIGIITAAALSMSSLYKAYLIFFFSMIIPQILIMIYYGKHQHIALIVFSIIYIPATILLSKAIYNSRLSSIEAHLDLENSIEKLHRLSMTDALTNTYNRRYFFETSQNLVSTASRGHERVSLLMLDIDHFKKVNDAYGHQAGDYILINLAKEITKNIRENDTFARIGGEEFIILLNNTSLDGAKVIAEKIRILIERKEFIYNNIPIEITISIGLSELNMKNISIEDLYKQADRQLYIAKESGRNRTSS